MSTENKTPDFDINIPRQAYKLRCLECEKRKSSKGNPMLVQTFEIFDAKPIADKDGNIVEINGVKVQETIPLMETTLFRVNPQRQSLGLPMIKASELDDINAEEYKGLEGPAVVVSVTEEQKDDNGNAIINPYTEQPVIRRSRKVTMWLARE